MRVLWALVHELQKTSKRMRRQLGVTGPQRLVLRVVGLSSGMSAGTLAKVLHVHPSTLTGVFRRLQSQGLLRRYGDPRDARRSVFQLSVKGARVNRAFAGDGRSSRGPRVETAFDAPPAARTHLPVDAGRAARHRGRSAGIQTSAPRGVTKASSRRAASILLHGFAGADALISMSRTQSIPLARRLGRWLEDVRLREHQLALVLSLVVGTIVGLVVVAFILLTGRLGARMYPAGGAACFGVLSLAGALITGFLLRRYFPMARGSGIPQTKAALFLRRLHPVSNGGGEIRLCSVTLASGIALGREGPSVQSGGGIASTLGRSSGCAPDAEGAGALGAAAALAAAFNTPIAAVLFALEEVMGDMHAPVLGSVVLELGDSWIVLHLLLGDEPLFHVPATSWCTRSSSCFMRRWGWPAGWSR